MLDLYRGLYRIASLWKRPTHEDVEQVRASQVPRRRVDF